MNEPTVETGAPMGIESNVPMPTISRQRGVHYPFEKMQVTQSFFVPCREEDKERLVSRISSKASYYARITQGGKWRFTTRRVEGGVRCWRVE